MDRILIVILPALAVVWLIVVLYFPGSSVSPDNAPPPQPTNRASHSSSVANSPFSISTPDVIEGTNESVGKQFEQVLHDYQSGKLSPEEKRNIKKTLGEFAREPKGRTIFIETFFSSEDPQLAKAAYALIRDADIKNVPLLEGLIQHDSTKHTTSSMKNLIDLIADLNTQKEDRYSPVIDRYLAQQASHSDAELRTLAASQRIWYFAQHQSNNLAALSSYLVNDMPIVREEMYSMIESRIADQTIGDLHGLSQTLNAALQADNRSMSIAEKARATALLQSLRTAGAL